MRAPLTTALLAVTAAVPLLGQQPATALQPMPAQPRQGPSQEKLIAQRDKKLGKEVFQNADWVLDFAEAKKRAADQDKLILVYFTRSYAP